ncbi:hypothetical protein WJX72_006479 [[Myrmecia] bisecta]|uniref:Glutathione S-transferase n=1 Tax=[Myrmecia] bisecta TaxID=41462 RepID=A0AAW1R7D7_9CHLO
MSRYVVLPAPSTAVQPLSWEDIVQATESAPLDGYTLTQVSPATAPSPVLPTSEHSTTDKPVLLYRDTNAWCPFCERVWLALEEKQIPYDTVLINLRDKPDWYKAMVPSLLVPAAKIKGELVYESYDILKKLEAEFPDRPLLPEDPQLRKECNAVTEAAAALQSAGYSYMSGEKEGGPKLPELKDTFQARVRELDAFLGRHEGPYFMGQDISMADIMYTPALERFAANMPAVRGFHMRDNPDYANLAAWYKAMDLRPAYQKVKSDDTTLNLVVRKYFGLSMAAPVELEEPVRTARQEAAAKITRNREAINMDIMKNTGIVRGRTSSYGGTLSTVNGYASQPSAAMAAAVDHALRRVCNYLIHGSPGPRHAAPEANAIGSAALAFFRNRASSPRDLSAAACHELREACLEVLKDMF